MGSVSERELAMPKPQLVPESRLWPPSVMGLVPPHCPGERLPATVVFHIL
jgi:hypothetical protein